MAAPLLIIWHSRTSASEQLARAAADAAGEKARLMWCEDVQPADLQGAQGYLFVCPENLAALSGAMKEMFDRCYYPVLGTIEGRAYATIIAAGTDGTNALRQLDRIATGWRLKRVADPLLAVLNADSKEAIEASKTVPDHLLRQASELAEGLAEGLALGVF